MKRKLQGKVFVGRYGQKNNKKLKGKPNKILTDKESFKPGL